MDNVQASEHADVPWFFTTEPNPTEGALWCSALFATAAVLAARAGVGPEQTDAMVKAAMEAIAHVPDGTSAVAELDVALLAAGNVLRAASV